MGSCGNATRLIGWSGSSTTTTTYHATNGRVTDAADNTTSYEYYGSGEAHPGRVEYVENADGKKTRYAYTDHGQVEKVWGDVPQPVLIEFDDFGQREYLTTFRTGTGFDQSTWPTGVDQDDGDTTKWTYDGPTGLLTRKTYADSDGDPDGEYVTYTYTADGKLHVRTWARGVTTTYDYDDETGELTDVVYSDSTPAVQRLTYDEDDDSVGFMLRGCAMRGTATAIWTPGT